MKKLIYILLFLFASLSGFSQDDNKNNDSIANITNISVYPNPFNDKTTISFYSSTENNITFIVQDLLGNIVKSENINLVKGKNEITFYKNKLVAGIYIYTLKNKSKVISKRFVIK